MRGTVDALCGVSGQETAEGQGASFGPFLEGLQGVSSIGDPALPSPHGAYSPLPETDVKQLSITPQ